MRFISSSIGKKILMSLTGVALIGFLVMHLSGNLLLFAGEHIFNEYSHKLVSNPLIVVAELILLFFFLSNMINGIWVTIRNRQSRPDRYYMKKAAGHTSRKSLASSSMIISGLFLLVFIVIHLKDFKYGTHYEVAGGAPVRDLYRLVIEEFKEPGEVIFYVFVMLLIGAHLWHGFGSAFESVGVAYRPWIRGFGKLLAVAIAGGFAAIPILIYFTK